MKFELAEPTRRQGRVPHELAMVNLIVINLLLCGGILASTLAKKGSTLEYYKLWLVLLPLLLSLAVIAWSFVRAAQAQAADHWFVAVQWQIAVRRYRFLLIAYVAEAVLTGLAWLLSQANPALHEVMFVALVRVAVAPLLLAVMVLAVLESSALFQTITGEVPEREVERMPPPPALLPQDSGATG